MREESWGVLTVNADGAAVIWFALDYKSWPCTVLWYKLFNACVQNKTLPCCSYHFSRIQYVHCAQCNIFCMHWFLLILYYLTLHNYTVSCIFLFAFRKLCTKLYLECTIKKAFWIQYRILCFKVHDIDNQTYFMCWDKSIYLNYIFNCFFLLS